MPDKLTLLSLVPFLGREITDLELQDTLTPLGAKAPFEPEEVLESHYLELEDAGLSFIFNREDEVRGKLPSPVRNGALVLEHVRAFGGSEKGYARFAGELPEGITFDMSRDAIIDRLGKPDWSSPAFPVDRWHKSDHRMTVNFQKEKPNVTIGLP